MTTHLLQSGFLAGAKPPREALKVDQSPEEREHPEHAKSYGRIGILISSSRSSPLSIWNTDFTAYIKLHLLLTVSRTPYSFA
jgi:hypothetical protein